jgi:hypothetical protein
MKGVLHKFVTHGGGKHERFCLLFEDTMCWYKSPHVKCDMI